jgi:hypothetical protein
MGSQFRFADEVADAFAASQAPRAMDEFSHAPRLSV